MITNKYKLRNLTLILTYKCNLRCRMCGQAQADSSASNSQSSSGQLSFDIIKKNLQQLPDLESVYLFGGEPLIYKEFRSLIEFTNKLNIKTLFSTNGFLLKNFVDDIVKNNVHMVSISLDSHDEKVHDDIRCVKGAFGHTLEGIESLINRKTAMNSSYPLIKLHFTITDANYKSMEEFYHFFIEKLPGIDRIMFHAPRYTNLSLGANYERVMREHFGLNVSSWRGFLDQDCKYSTIDTNVMHNQLRRLLSLPKVVVKGPVDRKDLDMYFNSPESMLGRNCVFVFQSCGVQPNGDVVSCVDYPDYVVGNIYDEALIKIWEGVGFERLRSFIKSNGSIPICAKCSRRFADVYKMGVLPKSIVKLKSMLRKLKG